MENNIPQPTETILPDQVWGTLDAMQQQMVLQLFVSLCQQIILIWEKEQNHDQLPNQ